VRNGVPLRFAAVVSTLPQQETHLQKLGQLAPPDRLDLVRLDKKCAVHDALRDTGRPLEILYFYTHGGRDPGDSSFLLVGQGERIKVIDLDSWRVKPLSKQTLVILNTCESAAYSPAHFENLIQFFSDRGAAGVIGSQCDLRELLADAFIRDFFRAFLGEASLGDALLAARRRLLTECYDPRGLAYSLFACAEVRLAQPIIQ
jgi:CHAT domain-containing protein